ncbi:MAG TPA: hypothetical protein VK796_11285 [Cytophaga sp.]|nr:hypothetical protein [Cytophaga sp.]
MKQALNALPFFKSSDYTIFLIVGHPRTGTSLLHTYLNSHWNILSLNEPLASTVNKTILFKKQPAIIKAAGFKYFYEYIEDITKRNTLIELLKKGNIKIIKIERKNYLRTYVSRCIAEKTNEWSSTKVKQHAIDYKKIMLTKGDCLLAFAQYKKNELDTDTIIKAFNTPVFKTDYETLVAEPDTTMFAIQKFLNVSQRISQSLLLRQNAEPLNVLVENYYDLKKSFSGTEFETFFDE